jgi:hypothetical protein
VTGDEGGEGVCSAPTQTIFCPSSFLSQSTKPGPVQTDKQGLFGKRTATCGVDHAQQWSAERRGKQGMGMCRATRTMAVAPSSREPPTKGPSSVCTQT